MTLWRVLIAIEALFGLPVVSALSLQTHRRGQHEELESTSERFARSFSKTRLQQDYSKDVLLFAAVGASNKSIKVMKKNVEKLREALPGKADVFFAHYGNTTDAPGERRMKWITSVGQEWYDDNVQFCAEADGIKFGMLRRLLTEKSANALSTSTCSSSVNIRDYRWIWVLDEDMIISNIDFPRFFQDADASGALIVEPGVTFPHAGHPVHITYWHPKPRVNAHALSRNRELVMSDQSARCHRGKWMCPHQRPNHDCMFRYTNFIELMLPVLRADAFKVMMDCQDCSSLDSDWGTDDIWCHMTSRVLGHPPERACAILDQHKCVHLDTHALKTNWNTSMTHATNVYNHYMDDLVGTDWHPLQNTCVGFNGTNETVELKPKVPRIWWHPGLEDHPTRAHPFIKR